MSKVKNKEQDLTYLSSYVSKVLKLKFGKGPETCFATMRNNILVVRIHQFMTPTESVLFQKNEESLALQVRTVLLNTIFEEIKTELSTLVGMSISSFYHDWDFKSNQGLLLFVAGASINYEKTHANEGFELLMCQKVQMISERTHKRPKLVQILKVSPTVLVVESFDVLITTDNLLYRGGYHELLMERSHEIRKNYNRYKEELEEILHAQGSQLFLTWDYVNNKSYLIFCLK